MQLAKYCRALVARRQFIVVRRKASREGTSSLRAILGGVIRAEANVSRGARCVERRILIVDDSLPARTCIKQVLSPFGWRMDEACDGASAFGMILEDAYDLLITDLQMSPVNGADLVAAVSLLPEWKRPRIMICSADVDAPSTRFDATMRQADAAARKPFDPVALAIDVLRLMEASRVARWES